MGRYNKQRYSSGAVTAATSFDTAIKAIVDNNSQKDSKDVSAIFDGVSKDYYVAVATGATNATDVTLNLGEKTFSSSDIFSYSCGNDVHAKFNYVAVSGDNIVLAFPIIMFEMKSTDNASVTVDNNVVSLADVAPGDLTVKSVHSLIRADGTWQGDGTRRINIVSNDDTMKNFTIVQKSNVSADSWVAFALNAVDDSNVR